METQPVPEFDLLRFIPFFAIKNLLRGVEGDEPRLNNLRGNELIDEVRRNPHITGDDIQNLFEEYRYGGKACFYIYLLATRPNIKQIPDVAKWNEALAEQEQRQQPDNPENASKIAVKDKQQLMEGITEIRFKYQKVHKYIDPDDEVASSVDELHYGFLWLNLEELYMVIMVKDETANPIIENVVNQLTGCIPSAIRLTKEFVRRHFNYEDLSSASWTDRKNDIIQTYTGEGLFNVMGEAIREYDETFDRNSGLYKETIHADLESKLGLQLAKGKLYLTRTISATNLRTWMYRRLHPLILSMRTIEPAQMVLMSTEPLDDIDLEATGERIFREIAGGIIELREHPDRIKPLSFKTKQLLTNMRQYFWPADAVVLCDQCRTESKAYCTECESDKIKSSPRGFECIQCGHTSLVPNAQVNCMEGHLVNVPKPDDCLVLRPKSVLHQNLANFIQEKAQIPFNPEEELFWLDSAGLHYVVNTNQCYYLPEDFTEFGRIPRREDITAELWTRATDRVRSINEKCDANRHDPTRAHCVDCTSNNLGYICIPKLFRALNPDFMPGPHGGYEFGDVSMQLTLEGRQKTFLGMAKSKGTRVGDAVITHNSNLGINWVSQIIRQAIRDNRVEIFGIITPKRLDPEYFASVKMLAKMSNKPFVYFGEDDLTKMFCALLMDPAHRLLLDRINRD
jgi:hypothetical protein